MAKKPTAAGLAKIIATKGLKAANAVLEAGRERLRAELNDLDTLLQEAIEKATDALLSRGTKMTTAGRPQGEKKNRPKAQKQADQDAIVGKLPADEAKALSRAEIACKVGRDRKAASLGADLGALVKAKKIAMIGTKKKATYYRL